jgi:hypothetical protein
LPTGADWIEATNELRTVPDTPMAFAAPATTASHA